METRYSELDALRGIAASIVVLFHVSMVDREALSPLQKFVLFKTPLRILFAGHVAVLFFFLLSGFVLTLPYLRGPQRYIPFMVKRIFRIYLPYLAALFLAVIGAAFLHNPMPSLSPWFSATWSMPISWPLVFQHVLFLGKYQDSQFNGAFWSLIFEMRISIFFPIVYLLAKRLPLAVLVLLALAASGLNGVLHTSLIAGDDYLPTLHYAGIFAFGSYLAQHRNALRARVESLKPPAIVALVVVIYGLVIYGYQVVLKIPYCDYLSDWPIVLGCSGILILAYSHSRFSALLRSPVPQFLGRISYSLYLIHATVLFTLIHLLYGRISLLTILPIYLFLSVFIAWLFYLSVEVPTMNAGRKAAARINSMYKTPSTAQ